MFAENFNENPAVRTFSDLKFFSLFTSSRSSCSGPDVSGNPRGRRVLLCPPSPSSKQKVKSRGGVSIPTAAEADTRRSLPKRRNIALLEEVTVSDVHQAAARLTVSNHRPAAATNVDHEVLGGERSREVQ